MAISPTPAIEAQPTMTSQGLRYTLAVVSNGTVWYVNQKEDSLVKDPDQARSFTSGSWARRHLNLNEVRLKDLVEKTLQKRK